MCVAGKVLPFVVRDFTIDLTVPDLEMIVESDENDLASDLQTVEQRTGDEDAGVGIDGQLEGVAEEGALDSSLGRVEVIEQGVLLRLFLIDAFRIDFQAGIQAEGDIEHVARKILPIERWQGQTILLVDGLLLLTYEHFSPLPPTIIHIVPTDDNRKKKKLHHRGGVESSKTAEEGIQSPFLGSLSFFLSSFSETTASSFCSCFRISLPITHSSFSLFSS